MAIANNEWCPDKAEDIKWCIEKSHLNIAYEQGRVDAIEPIKQIINDYEEGTDLWEGMDSEYVISRIIEQLKEKNK